MQPRLAQAMFHFMGQVWFLMVAAGVFYVGEAAQAVYNVAAVLFMVLALELYRAMLMWIFP